MEIKQIVKDETTVFGLGVDNKVYRWVVGKGEWIPYWTIDQLLEKTEVKKAE